MHDFFVHHQLILHLFLIIAGFLGGIVDAIAGGGGLVSLPALLFTGMPITTALGTSKFQGAIGTSIAAFNYYKGGLIDFKSVYRGLITGFIGATIGAILVNFISNHFMSYIVPFLMLAIFIFNLVYRSLGLIEGKKRMNEVLFFSIFGFIIGFYDAFFGPATGNLWIIAIVFFLGYNFLNASGYAKVLNVKSNLFSLAIFIYYGKVNFTIGFLMVIGQIIGGYLGSEITLLKGAKFIRPFFMLVIAINILILFYQMIFHHDSQLIVMNKLKIV